MARGILVTGGTGTVGRPLVARLQAEGHDVTAASRRTGIDLVTRTGLDAVLQDAPVVVHCATDTAHAGRDDPAATRTLLTAAEEAGCPHIVYISIVGIDGSPFVYYRRKAAVERMIENGRTPWTIVRTTQFHELLERILRRLTWLPVVPTSRSATVQPIAADDVAAHLASLALAEPAGRVHDLGGPEILTSRQLISTYLSVTRRRRIQLPVPLPGRIGRAFRSGAATVPDQLSGTQTWREHLEAQR